MAGIGGPMHQQSGIPRRPPQPPAEDHTPYPAKGLDEHPRGDATQLLLSDVSDLLGRFEKQLMRNLDQWMLRHADSLRGASDARMGERSSTLEKYISPSRVSTSMLNLQRSSTFSQSLPLERQASPFERQVSPELEANPKPLRVSDGARLKPEPAALGTKLLSRDSQVGGSRVNLMRENSPRESLNVTFGPTSGQTNLLPQVNKPGPLMGDITQGEGPKRGPSMVTATGCTGGASVEQQRAFEPRPNDLVGRSLSEEDTKRRNAAELRVITDRRKTIKTKASLRMESLVTSHQFEAVIAVAIVANAAFIGVEAQFQKEHLNHQRTVAFFAIECVFTFIFIVEWLLRVIVAKKGFFRGPDKYWNILDTALVICSFADTSLNTLVYTGALENEGVEDVTTLRLLRVLRIAKIVRTLRMTRLFRFVASLRTLVASIAATLQSLMWALLLLLLMIYSVAVVFTQALPRNVVDRHDPRLAAYWGSLPTAMRTLFQSITCGIVWQDAAEPLDDVSWLLAALFMLYIFLSVFAVLNVVTGVFCQSAIEAVALDPELSARNAKKRRKTHARKLRALFTAGDVDSSGQLNIEELESLLADDIVQSYLAAMNIDVEDAWSTFKLLDVDESLSIDREEFVAGMMRLQGSNRNAQLQAIMQTQKWMSKQIHIPETIQEEETAED